MEKVFYSKRLLWARILLEGDLRLGMSSGAGSPVLLEVLVRTPHRLVKSGVADVHYRLAVTESGKCFVSDVRIL